MRGRQISLLIFFAICSLVFAAVESKTTTDPTCSSCCFAHCSEFDLSSDEGLDAYITQSLHYDGWFATNKGGGLVEESGLTIDHCLLDPVTGDSELSTCATFTASSKESLHVALLAKVIDEGQQWLNNKENKKNNNKNDKNDDKKFLMWNIMAGATDPSDAMQRAMTQLDRKMSAYERLRSVAPGLGGSIPWCGVDKQGWMEVNYTQAMTYVPALDNGQLAWSLLVAADVLGHESPLGSRVKAHADEMVANIIPMFYNAGKGSFHNVVRVKNPRQPVSDANIDASGMGYLMDPYEGELFQMLADLFAPWHDYFPSSQIDTEKERQWINARVNLVPVNYTHSSLASPITVLRGWRFSAHEQWKFMVLPYSDSVHLHRLQANAERARTWNSHVRRIPGMMASCYADVNTYVDTYGIPEISMGFSPYSLTSTTPYASFPLFLVNPNAGAEWHRAMTRATLMQANGGSVEAFDEGTNSTTLLMSWDTKMTTALAMGGGIVDLSRRVLQREGKLDRFLAIVDRETKLAFTSRGLDPDNLAGEDLPFASPPSSAVNSSPQVFPCCPLH